jgi:hypothetical protein
VLFLTLSAIYAVQRRNNVNRTTFPFFGLQIDAQGHTLSFFAPSSLTPLRGTCTTQESKLSGWLINGFIAHYCPPSPFSSSVNAIELCD